MVIFDISKKFNQFNYYITVIKKVEFGLITHTADYCNNKERFSDYEIHILSKINTTAIPTVNHLIIKKELIILPTC